MNLTNRTRPAIFFLSVLAAATIAPSSFAFAQAAASAQAVVGAQVPLSSPASQTEHTITLDVVATNKAGSPTAGLAQQDFTVMVNKAPQKIVGFRAMGSGSDAASTEPVEVTIVVDAVNSPVITVSYARDQIKNFLLKNEGKLPYPVSMAFVTDSGLSLQNTPSTDGKAVAAYLEKTETGLRQIRRSEGIYGAEDRFNISRNALQTLVSVEARKPGRKLIVWVSPGWPLFSGPRVDLSKQQEQWLFNTVVGFSDLMRKGRVTLYSADPIGSREGLLRVTAFEEYLKGISKPSQADAGDLALQVLSEQSGGRARFGSNDVTGEIADAVAEASAYYTITIEAAPGEHPNEYRSIQVQVDKPGLTARTRTGYYAQP
jgi:VWFA-related protein